MTQEVTSLGARLAALAAQYGDARAVSFEDETLSWSELNARTNRMAHALIERGVQQGDLVTLVLPNSIGFVEACWACWKVGATPQPVSSRLPPVELSGIVALADPPLVIGAAVPGLARPNVGVDELLAASLNTSAPPDRIAPSWKAPASGGSSGRPKLIVAGERGIAQEFGPRFWRLQPDDRALMPGPMYHNGPFASAFSALMVGAELTLMPKFDAEGVLREIERRRATWLYLVPTMMSRIWRLPEATRARYDVSSLRTVWHLAAPCPAWLKEAWIEWLGPQTIWELYGGTEAQAGTVINGSEWLSHRGSVGRVFYGKIKVCDEQGDDVAPGVVGEVFLCREDGTPPSYRYIGAEARRLGDWESLGDVGWFDSDGYLYLADRRGDMILVGGANVYPAEVESALDAHPLVQSSAVIGLPDDDLGSRIHAIVQAHPGLDLDDLRRHLGERLVMYKHPRTFEFVSEPLRDEAGKVRRSQLRSDRLGPSPG